MKITGPIPEHIRRLMPPDDRRACAAPTMDEQNARHEHKRETKLQHDMVALLGHMGIVVNVSRTDRRKTDKKGWPDLTFAVQGLACGVEVKTATGQRTPEQVAVMERMAANGWRVAVVRTLGELREFVLKAGGRPGGGECGVS